MFKTLIAFCLSRRAIVVFALLLFAAAGAVAFRQLNIEAYPNPTPVILEITAQAPGLSAEEMERYYTRPIEIGLYTVPGIEVIRSTSFSAMRSIHRCKVMRAVLVGEASSTSSERITPASIRRRRRILPR